MKLSRRAFLAGAGAVISQNAFGSVIDLSKENETAHVLTARRALASILPSDLASPTAIWGFDGIAPGPVLRAKAGERVKVVVENDLNQSTSVHWHGIRIDNAMDGVPGLTQEAIAPGGRFVYDFEAPDPGTYWYHSQDRKSVV